MSSDAARTAIELCRATGLRRTDHCQLSLIGVISPRVGTQPGHGALVRRRREVEDALARTADEAREADLAPTVSIRVGDAVAVLQAEAGATEAENVYLVRRAGLIERALPGRGRVHIQRLAPPTGLPSEAAYAVHEAA